MATLGNYVSEALKRGYSKQEVTQILIDKGYTQREISLAFGNLDKNKNEIEIRDSQTTYINRIGQIFSSPTKFFSENRESSIKNSSLLFLTTGLCISVLSLGVGYLFSALLGSSIPFGFGSYFYRGIFGAAVWYSVILFGVMLGGTFVYSGIVHLALKVMKGEGRFTDTYNACTYSLIPTVIISLLPVIGFLSFIYAIVLATIGLSEYHQVSKVKAAISAIIPIIVVVALFTMIIFYFLLSFNVVF